MEINRREFPDEVVADIIHCTAHEKRLAENLMWKGHEDPQTLDVEFEFDGVAASSAHPPHEVCAVCQNLLVNNPTQFFIDQLEDRCKLRVVDFWETDGNEYVFRGVLGSGSSFNIDSADYNNVKSVARSVRIRRVADKKTDWIRETIDGTDKWLEESLDGRDRMTVVYLGIDSEFF